jgi:pyrrolidone-carboxylate peptidase
VLPSDATTIVTSGNAPGRMIITTERVKESLASRGMASAGRTAVTVFEP